MKESGNVQGRLNAHPFPVVFIFVLMTLFILMLVSSTLTGCRQTIFSQTGDAVNAYAVKHMIPDMMASEDLSMACETGVSMAGLLNSFGRVTDTPAKALLVTYLSAGMCAEAAAWEEDLRQGRALRDGRSSEARDARIATQREHAVAASRFYSAFLQLEGVFGAVGEGCPKLRSDDELFYLLGLSAALLALVHDRSAEGLAGVPMDLPHKVARASACLDDDKWWGAPGALQAAVWASVPGAAPEGKDPVDLLMDAVKKGESAGVRLARAFQIQTLESVGRGDAVRESITAHAASLEKADSNADWVLLDKYATRMILHVSDRIWTRDQGHRTPLDSLGKFWEPPVEEDYSDDDDLFGDIFDD